ncbi:hypothetical protein I1A62_29800 [Rhodococcus sp. USK10]|uniref:hypothetical protein n=1 Tax=Rhodococcus sp. USK10 TaxID=2789739 RepID=UPI001C5D0D71|nr:hypothetical protein [Rhodococcus sp. USK10]QYB01430.1 hypothetical protein I1A62_29800 [Rhodococcus sp. USK10]
MPGVQSANGKSPAVLLGEAREALQRALLFGDAEEIEAAQHRIDSALDRQAAQRRVRRADSIRAALAQLPDTENESSSPVDRAARGEILASELYDQWNRDPDSLQLKPHEKQFVKGDIRRLRVLVDAARTGDTFNAVFTKVRDVESSQRSYALAARADDPRELSAVQGWLADYIGQQKG